MSRWVLFAHNGLEYGPVEEEELIAWIKERRVCADDLVKTEGNAQWQLIGEVSIFSRYFEYTPGEEGRIKKNLKNENDKLKLTMGSLRDVAAQTNCEGCSFIEGVERMHEEKKVLEEKLAEERARLREVERWK